MLRSRSIHLGLAFIMAAYLPLWICCASHAAAAPQDSDTAATATQAPACHAVADSPCSISASRATDPDQPRHNPSDQDCTCTARASAAFVNKTAAASVELVQSPFNLLPGSLGKIIDDVVTTPALMPRVPIDASPPGGSLLAQFCLLTT